MTDEDEEENNIKAWLRILVEPMQEISDALQQLRTGRGVDDAEGEVLNLAGKLVGQPRDGLVDVDYRRYIKAKRVANNSTGAIEDLILIAKLILDDDDATIFVQNQGDAALLITILGIAVSNDLANILISFLQYPGAGGGVRVILQTSAEDPSTWMRWDVDNWDTKVMMTSRDRPR